MSHRFGERLYDLFFQACTEKVWGVPGSEIRAEWAAQRIKGLSLPHSREGRAARRTRRRREEPHPRVPLPATAQARCGKSWPSGSRTWGRGRYRRASRADHVEDGRVAAVEAGSETIPCADAISSLPLRAWPKSCGRRRRRRHSPRPAGSRTATSSRLRSSSRATTSSPTTGSTCTIPRCGWGASRTSAPGAPGWSRKPANLRRARVLLLRGRRPVGLRRRPARRARRRRAGGSGSPTARRPSAATSSACRRPTRSTTPTMRTGSRLAALGRRLDGLQQVGRNGLHRYNNSDHSMLTAIRAVDNLVTGGAARPLGGERGRRLSRGARPRRAPLHPRPGALGSISPWTLEPCGGSPSPSRSSRPAPARRRQRRPRSPTPRPLALVEVASGLASPMQVVAGSEPGVLYVVEQAGTVRVLRGKRSTRSRCWTSRPR